MPGAVAGLIALVPLLTSQAVLAQEPVAPPSGYVDRLIADGQLTPQISSWDDRSGNQSGPLRSIQLELGGIDYASSEHVAGVETPLQRQSELGLSASGRLQTRNYGLLGIDVSLRRGANAMDPSGDGRSIGGVATLSARSVPLGTGWVGDGSLGLTSAPGIALARRQARFFLPQQQLLGAAIVIDHLASGESSPAQDAAASDATSQTFNLAIGRPGYLAGVRAGDFVSFGGTTLAAGWQMRLARQLTGGFQALSVAGSQDPYAIAPEHATLSGKSVLGVLNYSGGRTQIQANGLWSNLAAPGRITARAVEGTAGSAWGGWVDADWREGRRAHGLGVYVLGPGLSWGANALVSNAWGGYYRLSSLGRRWQWTLNIDGSSPISGSGLSGALGTFSVRHQVAPRLAAGGEATVRIAGSERGATVRGYLERSGGIGTSRIELGWTGSSDAKVWRIGVGQDWLLPGWMPSNSRLSTTASYERYEGRDLSATPRSDNFGFSLSMGTIMFRRFTLDGTISWNSNSASSLYGPYLGLGDLGTGELRQRSQGFSASLSASVRLTPRWSLAASFTDNQSWRNYARIPLVTSPLGATGAELLARQRSSSRLVSGAVNLRYAFAAGRPFGAIGRRSYPGPGSGEIAGTVYLDENGNGKNDPGEPGVPNIVVMLDGFYQARSDQTGHWRFDGVAEGSHRINVVADNLPLPWMIMGKGEADGSNFVAEVATSLRKTTRLDIGATR